MDRRENEFVPTHLKEGTGPPPFPGPAPDVLLIPSDTHNRLFLQGPGLGAPRPGLHPKWSRVQWEATTMVTSLSSVYCLHDRPSAFARPWQASADFAAWLGLRTVASQVDVLQAVPWPLSKTVQDM